MPRLGRSTLESQAASQEALARALREKAPQVADAVESVFGPENPPVNAVMSVMDRVDPMGTTAFMNPMSVVGGGAKEAAALAKALRKEMKKPPANEPMRAVSKPVPVDVAKKAQAAAAEYLEGNPGQKTVRQAYMDLMDDRSHGDSFLGDAARQHLEKVSKVDRDAKSPEAVSRFVKDVHQTAWLNRFLEGEM